MAETTVIEPQQQPSFEDVKPPAPPEPQQEGRRRNPREEMVAAIAQRAEEQRLKEMRDYEVSVADTRDRAGLPPIEHEPEEELSDAEPAEEPVAQHAAEPPAPAPQQAQAPEQQLFDVDVPGLGRIQVTREQAWDLYNRGALGGQQQPQYAPQQPPQTRPAGVPPQQQVQPLISTERAREAARKLTYGNEDEGAAALQAVVAEAAQRLAQPYVDPNVIRQAAVQEAVQYMQGVQVLQQIGHEYQDIFGPVAGVNDPTAAQRHLVLSNAAAMEVDRLRRQAIAFRQPIDNLQICRAACNNVRAVFSTAVHGPGNGSGNGQQAPQVAVSPSKLASKRAAPAPPMAVSRTAGVADQPRAPTGSEYVNAMRKSRGQVPYA